MLKITTLDRDPKANLSADQFDLVGFLNDFFKQDTSSLDFLCLENALSCIEKNSISMHDFLEQLVNCSLWQEWKLEHNPYKSMILQVGTEIDRLSSLRGDLPYHSKSHTMDVCFMLSCLLKSETKATNQHHDKIRWVTSVSEKWLLLLSATAHDLGHSGLINSIPFELEQASLNLLKSLITNHDYDSVCVENVMESLTPWVLATDHAQYNHLLRRLGSSHYSHSDCLAMLLVEADLVSSVLPNKGRELSIRLSQEWAPSYEQESVELSSNVGYLKFLERLVFISPHSITLGIPVLLKTTTAQLKSELS